MGIIAKFIGYQRLVLKLELNDNTSAILPIGILLMVMKSVTFVRHPGPYTYQFEYDPCFSYLLFTPLAVRI